MNCENCQNHHDGKYGSGRFCSPKCSRGFSTKEKRSFINQKVSLTLQLKLNNGLTRDQEMKRRGDLKYSTYVRENEIASLRDLSSRTVSKVLRRMNLPCSFCGWHVDGVICDIHHIIERKKGGSDDHSNLTYICPNCHRLAHSGKIRSEDLINLDSYIGEKWREHYYIKDGKAIFK